MGKRYQRHKESSQQINQSLYPLPEIPLSPVLNRNIKILKSAYDECSDVVFREFTISGETDAVLLYIDGLSNTEELDENVLRPLIRMKNLNQDPPIKEISVSDVKEIYLITDVIKQISIGNLVILIDQQIYGISVGLSKWEKCFFA